MFPAAFGLLPKVFVQHARKSSGAFIRQDIGCWASSVAAMEFS
jgi:hypothetical protein